MRQATFLWAVIGATLGAMTWFGIQFFGAGRLQSDSIPIALIVGLFAFGLRWVNIPAPRTRRARALATVSPKLKTSISVAFIVLTTISGVHVIHQGFRGYPPLTPAQLNQDEEHIDSDFYTVSGEPMLDAMYDMSGSDGDYVLLPLKEYAGRLLVMLPNRPKAKIPIRVTGQLREKIRTVQRNQGGEIEGPFLRLYREHVNLAPNTQVYFLDTGKRAGINVQSVALLLVPLYFLLLILSMPTKPRTAVKSGSSSR